ncbi:hypothetical protein CIB48_g4622 [Xylaria polymorpha]|nr:hypothetical protein CIB48_g4622 [Xylaria polymorpha]
MPSHKDRLYICLFARGGTPKMPGLEDTYHWALMVGPKIETEGKRGTRHHAKETITANGVQWIYEKKDVSLAPTSMQLVRVMVGKVEDKHRLESVLRRVPIRAGTLGWNCVGWVQEALQELERDGKALGTSVTAWQSVRDIAMWYCGHKLSEGRFTAEKYNPQKCPTYDIIEGKETVE